jgi:hypothetical protein
VREGIEAWHGDTCATPIGELMETSNDDDLRGDGDHP